MNIDQKALSLIHFFNNNSVNFVDKEEAAAVIERLRIHQKRLLPNTELGKTVQGFCSFLEAVVGDILTGDIVGTTDATNGVVASAKQICDLLDGLSDEDWADIEVVKPPIH